MSRQKEENICNLIPKEPPPRPKLLKYVSKFSGQTKQEIVDSQRPHAHFGYQHYNAPNPCQYLRKHSKTPMTSPPEPQKHKLVALAKVDDLTPISFKQRKREHKNFLVNNKKEVKKAQDIYVPERKYVDTKGGDKHTLEPSGLKLRYVFKKDFGTAPKYLKRREEEQKFTKEERDRQAQEAIDSQKAKQVSEEERQELLKGLKENWAALNKAYSAQSLCIDNLPKQFRKESLERQMAALEKDIDLIERNRIILIASPRGRTESH